MSRARICRRRPGVVMVIVLVCLAVVMALIANWAKIAVLQSRQSRAAEDRLQAVWLADAAIDRAAACLRIDPAYQGENWQVAAAELDAESSAGPSAPGAATITVEPVEDSAGARQVSVQVDYPLTGPHANRVSKQVVVDLSGRGDTP